MGTIISRTLTVAIFSQNNDGRDCDQNNRCVKRRNMEGIFYGRGNRISNNLTDPAPADQAGKGKQYCQDRPLVLEEVFRNKWWM